MQRYNPMTKCLETVKTTDSKKRRVVDFKTNDTIKRIKVSELKEGQTIVRTGEVVKNLKEDGDKIIVTAKRVLAHGASPSIYKFAKNSTIQVLDNKTVDADYDSPSQMENKLKNFVNKAKTANSKQEIEKINNDVFLYIAKLKSNVLKKYGTTNNKFNSTEEWKRNYSKIASKYMGEVQKLVDNFKTKDNKTVDANNADLLLKRLSKDANKIQGIVSEIIRRKEWGNIDERGIKNLNKMIIMAESTIDELANISYRALSLPK